jgi:hypothetical protein
MICVTAGVATGYAHGYAKAWWLRHRRHSTRVVDGLELGGHGPSLVQVQAAADRLLAKLSLAYGDFDAAELWDSGAATSMTAWLSDRTGMVSGDAARLSRSAKRLRVLPLTAAAAVDGRLSAGRCGPSWPGCLLPRWGSWPSTRPRWCPSWPHVDGRRGLGHGPLGRPG